MSELIVMIDFTKYLSAEFIESVDDNSDSNGQRARVHFKNGHSLSIIRGKYSYGGDEGLFEIMPSDASFLDGEDSGEDVCGYLTPEMVNYYINKIGSLSKLD